MPKLKESGDGPDMKTKINRVLAKRSAWLSATEIANILGRAHPAGVGSTLKYMWRKGLLERKLRIPDGKISHAINVYRRKR